MNTRGRLGIIENRQGVYESELSKLNDRIVALEGITLPTPDEMRKKALGPANQGTAIFELQQQVKVLQDNLPKMSIWVYGEIDARLDALEANEPQIDPTAAIDTAFDAADTIEQQAREIAQLKGQIADMHKRCDCNNSPFSNWNL